MPKQNQKTPEKGQLFFYGGYIVKVTHVGTSQLAWNSPSLIEVAVQKSGVSYGGSRFRIPDGTRFRDVQFGITFRTSESKIRMG